jgi:hypothetical protein
MTPTITGERLAEQVSAQTLDDLDEMAGTVDVKGPFLKQLTSEIREARSTIARLEAQVNRLVLASDKDLAERDEARKVLETATKQIAALSKIDEKGIGHDDAMALVAHHVHEIQVLCDAFGYDPTEWLNDEAALAADKETTK